VLFRNLIPAPAFPYILLPYLVGGWLVLGLTVAAATPQLCRRVSEGLARSWVRRSDAAAQITRVNGPGRVMTAHPA
jgi:hypothetical protein